jgi:hypothetical protein
MTRTALIATLLCSVALPAMAENWVKSYGNETATEWVDMDSLKRTESKVVASLRRDYIDGGSRRVDDTSGKSFVFTRSVTVVTIDCDSGQRSIDTLWHVSKDGKQRSETKTYPMSSSNSPWDEAVRKIACKT